MNENLIEKIVITAKNTIETKAVRYRYTYCSSGLLKSRTIATAVCNPSDKFNFATGATIAFTRLMDGGSHVRTLKDGENVWNRTPQPGDKVRIVDHRNIHWSSWGAMDKWKNQIMTIKEKRGSIWRMQEDQHDNCGICGWNWSWHWHIEDFQTCDDAIVITIDKIRCPAGNITFRYTAVWYKKNKIYASRIRYEKPSTSVRKDIITNLFNELLLKIKQGALSSLALKTVINSVYGLTPADNYTPRNINTEITVLDERPKQNTALSEFHREINKSIREQKYEAIDFLVNGSYVCYEIPNLGSQVDFYIGQIYPFIRGITISSDDKITTYGELIDRGYRFRKVTTI